jgi:hypothetical protein
MSPAWPIGIVGQNPQFVCEPPDGDFISGLASITGVSTSTIRAHSLRAGRSPMVRFSRGRPGGLEPFLARLACFVHRTETWWQDTVGRELYGAWLWASGAVPAAVDHAERIEHGVDGLLYGSSAEARELLSDLRQSPATAAAMGRAGRNKMRALLDGAAQKRNYREFLPEPVRQRRQSSGTGWPRSRNGAFGHGLAFAGQSHRVSLVAVSSHRRERSLVGNRISPSGPT